MKVIQIDLHAIKIKHMNIHSAKERCLRVQESLIDTE